MAAIDIVNRVFREFKRYTGDGLPDEPTGAALPVGDPSSGPHNPKKSEIREALIAPITDAEDAADRSEAAAVLAEAYAALSGPTGVYAGTFEGDGTTTTFVMSVEPSSEAHVWVALGGVLQAPGSYSIDGTDLIFTAAPPDDVEGSYRIVSIADGEEVPPDLSVTTAKIGSLAVTKGKIADDSVDSDKIDGADAADIRTLLDLYSKAEIDAKFPDDEIALVTATGYGSTATRIVRFATVERDTSGGMTLTQSAANGDSITIGATGIYAMTAEIESSDASREFGISRNQSSLTTGITSITVSQQVCSAEGTASRRSNCSRTMRLTAGDVIRVCTDGGTLAAGAGDCRFSIVRIH